MSSYHYGLTGETYYAKPEPLSSSPSRDADIVEGNENGTTGSFVFELDPTKTWVVFLQAGDDPASTDTIEGVFPASDSATIQQACEAAIIAQNVDRLNAFRPRAI